MYGLASGLLGLVGSTYTNETNKAMAQEQRDFQKDLYDETNMWNSPQAQMARLKAAGVNPLASDMGNVPAQQFTPNQLPQMQNPLQAMSDAMMQKVNMDLAQAQADKARAEAEGIEIDNETRSDLNYAKLDSLIADYGLKQAQVDEIDNAIDVSIKRLELDTDDLALRRDIYSLSEKQFNYDVKINDLRYELDKEIRRADIDFKYKGVILESAKVFFEGLKADANVRLSNKQIDQIDKNLELIDAEIQESNVRQGKMISDAIATQTAPAIHVLGKVIEYFLGDGVVTETHSTRYGNEVKTTSKRYKPRK